VKVTFSERAWGHYLEWQGDDQRTLAKVNALIRDCMRDPFRGLGKPEPLEGNLKGWWSRRITGEHRLVYRAMGKGEAQALEVAQCRYNY
jgi:toxin YoeB